jgi:formylmethanofuran dehydrogenase subunit E
MKDKKEVCSHCGKKASPEIYVNGKLFCKKCAFDHGVMGYANRQRKGGSA